jgi:hypothetical protein
MAQRDYIEFNLNELPDTFETDFGEETFVLSLDYNEVGDFYTLDCFTDDDEAIVTAEPLMCGNPMWGNIRNARLPLETLIPMDESGQTKICNKETFQNTVFLYIDDLSPYDDDE